MSASKEQIMAFLKREFSHGGSFITIESVGNQASCIRRSPRKEDLRPGNTVSGPFMMVSLYSDGFDQPIAHATGTYSLPSSSLPPS